MLFLKISLAPYYKTMSEKNELIGVVIFLGTMLLLRYADEGVLFTTASKPNQIYIIVGGPEDMPAALATYVATDPGIIPIICLVFQ
jgi:hypothetical protein